MKDIKITPPEGYIIDTENSTLERIVFKKKELTYDDIAIKLFSNMYYYISGDIVTDGCMDSYITSSNIATSRKQLEKLLALNKLRNVAYYLNNGWKPDWDECDYKYSICIIDGNIQIYSCVKVNGFTNYFKTKELAQQAISILGEDAIHLALDE